MNSPAPPSGNGEHSTSFGLAGTSGRSVSLTAFVCGSTPHSSRASIAEVDLAWSEQERQSWPFVICARPDTDLASIVAAKL
jgi:hypothetical protein